MDFWQGQSALSVLEWITRAIVAFFWLLLVSKLMGQREIGRMTLFDFVIAVTIGSVAAGPLSDKRASLLGPLISVATLGVIDILIAYISIKNSRLRRVFQDEPLCLIQNGQLLEDTMRKARFNLDDLLTELRLKNYPNIHDVEFAFLESSGRVSVIPKSQARPAKTSDLKITTAYEGMPSVLVEDGNILEDNLKENGLDQDWLMDILKKKGINSVSQAMAVILDTTGRVYVSKKDQDQD